MISKLLLKVFVKNKTRENYGLFSSLIGIILNIFLFIAKFIIGTYSNSIAVTADAFNNLTDSISSIVTLIGFKLSTAPPDKEHPFGHGRIEYISGFLISVLISIVGIQFAKSSFTKILHPENVYFDLIGIILLVLSIVIKLWISRFNKYVGNLINSTALKASSQDAFNDVIITISIIMSLILSKFIKFPIDGYIGLLVSFFILYSAFKLVNETLSPLIGEPPSKELVENIKDQILSYEYISGCHDLIIHNYGHSKIIASIHAEVPCDVNIMKIHDVIDKAEQDISKKLGIVLVIHMDPINTNDDEIFKVKSYILEIIESIDEIDSIHDLRIIGDIDKKTILFDALVYSEINLTKKLEMSLKEALTSKIVNFYPNSNCIINIEKSFTNF